MPPTEKHSSLYLYIAFPGGELNPTFSPGNVVVGQVMRQSFLQRGIVKIQVTLYGRSKTKIGISHSSYNGTTTTTSTDQYRSRCHFFTDGTHEVSQVIHNGPVDISRETNRSGAWPFALTIPKYTHMCAASDIQQYSLIPASADDLSTHPLPDTFFSHGIQGSKSSESYVEYYIEARMQMSGEKDEVATYPIIVKSVADHNPLSDFHIYRDFDTISVHTYELQPHIERSRFTQKRRELFHSSKVPNFIFDLWVSRPRVVQISSQTPLPLYLKASAVEDRVSGAIKGIPQTLTLKTFTLKVKSNAHVIAPSATGRIESEEKTTFKAVVGLEVLNRLESPIRLTMDPKSETINLGALLQMQLNSDGLYIGDQTIGFDKQHVVPTFKTHNIDVTYSLKWTFIFELAGKEVKRTCMDNIIIIPHTANIEE